MTDSETDIRVFKYEPDGPVVETTDIVLKFPSLDRKKLLGKAPVATTISSHLHKFLKSQGVETHFAEQTGKEIQAVFDTEQLSFEISVRNYAADDLVEQFGIPDSHQFSEPLVEYFVKPEASAFKPTRVSEAHLLAFEMIDVEGLDIITQTAVRVNDLLTGVFFGIGVRLLDIRMEFGLHLPGEEEMQVIMLVSELSPDTMSLLDIKTNERLDSSRVFNNEDDGLIGFKEIARRLDIDSASFLLERQK